MSLCKLRSYRRGGSDPSAPWISSFVSSPVRRSRAGTDRTWIDPSGFSGSRHDVEIGLHDVGQRSGADRDVDRLRADVHPRDKRVQDGPLLGRRQSRPAAREVGRILDQRFARSRRSWSRRRRSMAVSSRSSAQMRSSTSVSRSAAGTRHAASDACGRPRLISDWLT